MGAKVLRQSRACAVRPATAGMEHQRPHKRRRQVPTGRFAGLAGGDDNNFLVLGLPSTIFDDPDAAAFVEEGHHLIEISPGNKSDRYDVRLLLDARVLNALEDPSLLTGGAPDEEDQQLHAELELERWRDLHEQAAEQPGGGDGLHDDHAASEDGDGSDTEGGSDQSEESGGTIDGTSGSAGSSPPRRSRSRSPPPAHVPPGNAYGAVGFAYNYAPEQEPEAEEQAAAGPHPRQEEQADLDPYVPRFDVPQHLQGALPLTERLHKVLVETARFVRRSGGGQVEVLLRVKQGSNPTFSFLFPGDRSHPYYRWIVDTNPKEVTPPPPAVAAAHASAGGAQNADQQQHEQQALAQLLNHYDDLSQQDSQEQAPGGPEIKQESSVKVEVKAEVKQEQQDEGICGPQTGNTARVKEEPEEAAPLAPAVPGSAHEQGQQVAGASTISASQDDMQAIKAVIDKLVTFVKRSGARFEATVRQREARNPRFAFLLPWNKHHPLYTAALAEALGSQEEADKLLVESAAVVAAAKQPAAAAPPPALPVAPAPAAVAAPPVITLHPPARSHTPPVPPPAAVTALFTSASTGAATGAPTPAVKQEEKPQGAAVKEQDLIAAAAQAGIAAAQAVFGPARQPLLLKANPAILGTKAAAPAGPGADMPAAGTSTGQQAAAAREGSPGPAGPGAAQGPSSAGKASEPDSVDTQQRVIVEGSQDEQQQQQEGAQVAAELERKLAERRARARALLAQKMAEKAKEEERQRVQAIQHHRNILLRGDDDATTLPRPSASTAAPARLPPAHAPLRPAHRSSMQLRAGTAESLQSGAAADDDWLLALEQQEVFAPSSAAATVSTHRAALARGGSPEPVLQPPAHPAPAQTTATTAGERNQRQGQHQASSTSSSSGGDDSGIEEGEVVEHRSSQRQRHKLKSRGGHHDRDEKDSRHKSRSSRGDKRSPGRESKEASHNTSRSSVRHRSRRQKDEHKAGKRSRSHSPSPSPAKAVRSGQDPAHAVTVDRSSGTLKHTTVSGGASSGSEVAPGDLRSRLRAMLGRVV